MKTINLNLYSFKELSPEAQNKIIKEVQSSDFFDFWQFEREESYNKAKEIYRKLKHIRTDEGELKGARLYAWIENNLSYLWREKKYISKHEDGTKKICSWSHKYKCTKKRKSNIFEVNNLDNCFLTGVCYDNDFLSSIINFMKNPQKNVSNLDLIKTREKYETVAERDFDYLTSEEYIREELEQDTEEKYTEQGEIFSHSEQQTIKTI